MGRKCNDEPQVVRSADLQHLGGLPVRKLNVLLTALILLAAGMMFYFIQRTNVGYEELHRATQDYVIQQQCAYDMQQASDYLTEQVRCFAMTGERLYLNNYFEEAQVTRRRELALERLQTVDCDPEAYEALQHAMEKSVALMEREYYSMRLIIEANAYELSVFPQEIRDVQLSARDQELLPSRQLAVARSMVFDDNYRITKEVISKNVSSCLIQLISATEARQSDSADRLHELLQAEHAMIFALVLAALTVVLMTGFLVIRPLNDAVESLRGRHTLPVAGAHEFRFLAHTFNQMFAAIQKHQQELSYAASHDQLTGLYNRSGYNQLRKTLDLQSCALVAIDVDHFKQINDGCGHLTGDRVLSLVADALKAGFREEDHVCRIGGDEFAVIMAAADPGDAELVRRTVDGINDRLRRLEGDLPPVTISAGAAFGRTEGDRLFKHADEALYAAKDRGRSCCVVYGEGKCG